MAGSGFDFYEALSEPSPLGPQLIATLNIVPALTVGKEMEEDETILHSYGGVHALTPSLIYASGRGPVFRLATPTNPQGGVSFEREYVGRWVSWVGSNMYLARGGSTAGCISWSGIPALVRSAPPS